MIVLRTIESFFPYISGPANQAYQISTRLEALPGIHSPILTSYCDVDPSLPAQEKFEKIAVTRIPIHFRLMRYCVTLGICKHLKNFDILHSHNYRNFQTDCGFFLPRSIKNLLF